MNQPAKRHADPTEPPPTPGAAEPSVRPKVLRRPAQFARSAAAPTDIRLDERRSKAVPAAAPPPTPVAPALPQWQDDGHFAIALLAIIIAVNVAVSLWLAPGSAQAPDAAAPVALPAAGAAPAVHVLDALADDPSVREH
ncbi:MAG: hypothetical protein SFW64_07175 [Alphaproteobacteria bacterium]|nr:hypothetical protein [Alphaproteobacteria bacterium]